MEAPIAMTNTNHLNNQPFRPLFIAEIFRNICSFSSKGTLVSLAGSCKAFHTTAIKALWHTLANLDPLISCLPEDAVGSAPAFYHELGRYLQQEDWDTFVKYAPYVQVLGDFADILPRQPTISVGLLQAICALRPTMVLLPNLRELATQWLGIEHDCIPYLLSITGKNLMAVDIQLLEFDVNNPADSDTVTAIIARLATLPRLQKLRYREDFQSEYLGTHATFSTLLRNSLPLTEIVCDIVSVSQEDIITLGHLPTLNDVSIRLPDEGIESWSQLPHNTAFHQVKRLSITSTALSYSQFADTMKLPTIPDFTLFLVDDSDPGVPIGSLITSIRTQFCINTLTSLHVTQAGITPGTIPGGMVVTPDDVRPLFDFTNLRNFRFVPASLYHIGDEFYREMAKAWPRIQYINFAEGPSCKHVPPLTTLRVLSYFAAHCPELKSLGLRFDATGWTRDWPHLSSAGPCTPNVPPELYSALGGKRSTSQLTRLMIDCNASPVDRPADVALYLLWVFPRLEEVFGCWDDDSCEGPARLFGRRWSQVNAMIPVLARMREIAVDDIGKAAGRRDSSPST